MANCILTSRLGRTVWSPGQKPPYGARVNPFHPLSQGLIGAWLFNEGGGKTAWDNVSNFGCSLTNGPIWENNYLSFATNRDLVSTVVPFNFGKTDPFSVSITVIFNSAGTYQTMIGNLEGNPYKGWQLDRLSTNQLRFYFNYNLYTPDGIIIDTFATYTANNIYNFVVTYDGSNTSSGVKIYVDGKSVTTASSGTSSITGSPVSIRPLRIAGRYDTSQYLNGKVVNAFVWKKTLTSQEIASLHANPYQMFYHPLYDPLGELDSIGKVYFTIDKNILAAQDLAGISIKKPSTSVTGGFLPAGNVFKKAATAFSAAFTSLADLVTQKIIGGPILKALEAGMSFVGAAVRKPATVIAGTLTSVASILKYSPRAFTATASYVGTAIKKPITSIVGALTSIGTAIKKPIKVLSGVLTSAGVLSKISAFKKALAGAMASTGTLIKKSATAFAAILTSSGKVIGRAGKALSGAMASTASLIKFPKKVLSGIFSPAGVLATLKGRILTAVLNTSGAISKSVLKPISAVLGSIGAVLISKLGLTMVNLEAALVPVGVVTRKISHSLTALASFIGNVFKAIPRTFAAAISFAGQVSKSTLKALAGSLTASGVLIRRTLKLLSGVLTSMGTVGSKGMKVLSGAVRPAGALLKSIMKPLSAVLSTLGQLVVQWSGVFYQLLAAGIGFSGRIIKTTSLKLSGILTSAATLVFQRFISQSLQAGLVLAGSVTRKTMFLMTRVLHLAGHVLKGVSTTLVRSFTAIGQVIKEVESSLSAVLSFTVTFEALKSVYKLFMLTLDGSISFASSTVKLISKILVSVTSWLALVKRHLITLFRREFPLVVLYIDEIKTVEVFLDMEEIVLFFDKECDLISRYVDR